MSSCEDVIRLAKEATDNKPLHGRKEFTFSTHELQYLIALAKYEALKAAANRLEPLCVGVAGAGVFPEALHHMAVEELKK